VPAVLLSIILSLLACGYVGLRMLRLAGRTRKLPELCMGVGLSAFALAQASRLAFSGFGARLDPELAIGMYGFMQLSYALALFGICFFTVVAFDIRSRWRWALLVGFVGLAVLSRSMQVHLLAPQLLSGAPRLAAPLWEPIAVVTFALAFGWAAVESLRYHALMRRRLALGLADPVVTNRFFVWGAGAGVTCLLVLLLTGLFLKGLTLMNNSLAASVVVTICGVLYAVVPVLTFVPPAAYLRFVERRAERSGAGVT
jgi:hypothetical protein